MAAIKLFLMKHSLLKIVYPSFCNLQLPYSSLKLYTPHQNFT